MLSLMLCTNTVKVVWDFHFILVHRRVFKEAIDFMEKHESASVDNEHKSNGVLVYLVE